MISDIIRLGRAKLRRAKNFPNKNDEVKALLLALRKSRPGSEEYSRAIDGLWLSIRRGFNRSRDVLEKTREFQKKCSTEKPYCGSFFDEFIADTYEWNDALLYQKLELKIETRKGLSERAEKVRENYYSYLNNEIPSQEYFSSYNKLLGILNEH